MTDAKQSLDYWRKCFNNAKSDIFDLIHNAILVAAVDCPKEFKDKKNLIVEKLYTCKLSLRNGDHEHLKEEKNNCNFGNSKENDQIVREVVYKKSRSPIVENTPTNSVNNLKKSSITDSELGCSSKLTSEQKLYNHLSAGVKRKQPEEEVSETSKLEAARKKLREGYQRIENAKRQRMIQIIEPTDLPKLSHEKRRSRKKVGKDFRN